MWFSCRYKTVSNASIHTKRLNSKKKSFKVLYFRLLQCKICVLKLIARGNMWQPTKNYVLLACFECNFIKTALYIFGSMCCCVWKLLSACATLHGSSAMLDALVVVFLNTCFPWPTFTKTSLWYTQDFKLNIGKNKTAAVRSNINSP